MNSGDRGPGVRKFWEALSRGTDVDVKAIFEEYPGEVLQLAGAIREAAKREDSLAREHMWLARAEVLTRAGEELTLGTMLRSSREDAGMSAGELGAKVRDRGVRLLEASIEQLEADRATITQVRIPGLWSTLAEILEIDRHRLVAMIQVALSGPETARRFTRMERGATAENRERSLSSELTSERHEDATDYVNWVRSDLGLPPSPTDPIQ